MTGGGGSGGGGQANLQLVLEKGKLDPAAWEAAKGAGNGAAVRVAGPLKLSPKEGQRWELPVGSIEIVGPSDGGSYPIPPAKINLETLRGLTHMRPRTGVMGAVMRVRNALAYATHSFFQKAGFMYVHAPLITGADCEGAGEMFQVTTLDLAKPLPQSAGGGVDYAQDFFSKPAYLTVSGQLNGEYFACAFGSIYTFGPPLPSARRQHEQRAAPTRRLLVHRPDLSRGELQHDAPPGRVLDDRAGDCLLRPHAEHGLRRGLLAPLLLACAGRVRRGPGLPRGLRGEAQGGGWRG